MNRIVKLMRCVVFAAALYAGSLSAQQVTPAMIQRAKAMGATQEQIDAALAERNERSGRPSSTQAQGSEVVRSDPDRQTKDTRQSGDPDGRSYSATERDGYAAGRPEAGRPGFSEQGRYAMRSDTDSVTRLGIMSVDPRASVFGREIFSARNLTFAPSYNIPTPPNYVLGAGDEVGVEVWGDAESTMKHRVSPEGSISISGVGPVSVAGLTIEQAQQRIQSKVDRIMSGQVRVSLGEIRSIKVNISGEVAVPGTYTLPSLATVFNAIYSAGGVNDIGSLRRIQVYRNSRKVADLDVYDYLVNGKYETNILLEDNDMIIVPPYDSYVAIGGKVKRERIYELKKGETLGKLIEYAGGFTGDAYAERLTVYRKSGRQRSLVTVEKADLDAFPMMDGDSLHVDVVLPTYSNMLTIRGAVWRPGDYELGPDVRTLSQLIAKAEGLRGSEFASRGQISRFDSTTSIYTVIPFVVSDVASGRTDVELRNRDEVYIPNVFDLREDYSVTVRGEVNAPQTLDYRDGMTVEDVIVLCGGLRESASRARVEVARRIKDPTSTSYSPRQAETFLFDISEDLAIAPTDKRFVLQPFDEVYIRRSPGYSEQKNAEADGEVLFPGQYVLAHASQRLSDLVRQAGGFTEEAYVRGASVQRKLTPDEMAKVKATLEIARTNQDRDSAVQDAVEIPEYYSIGVDVEQAVKKPGSSEDIVLREGDRLFVPKYNGTVRISGAVLYQNSVAYEGKKLKNYVAQAGGFKQRARRRPFIVYMNGKVASTRGGFLWKRYPAVEPGCQIVVPMKQEPKGNGLANAIGMMSSTASLAAMVASIINLSK